MKYSFLNFKKASVAGVSLLLCSFLNSVQAQCDNPAFTEGADRNYSTGDIISRDGKDYKVIYASWVNSSAQDWAYAPGTGSSWTAAWSLENDPCENTGGGGSGGGSGSGGGNGDGSGGGNGSGGGGNSGGVNSPSCISTTDDGQAEGTFYYLIDNGNVGKCSYNTPDLIGTDYGALEITRLQETNDAKYCGMCIKATGDAGTAIVQIVDECPDCPDKNVGDTDIDFGPSTFNAVVGDIGVGRASITWEEVSCPWQTPLHLIMQGSHDWYAKVIVGNHVNRIATLEISNDGGSSWESMTRGVDNGFVKGGYGGKLKSFKITDIYGDVIIMNDIDMVANGDAKVSGTENFEACQLNTSTNKVNSLNYVSIFPNPAITAVTFVGIEDVQSMDILNINGQVVASKIFKSSASQISLDISGFAPGIYVAKMTGDHNTGAVTFVKK